MDDEEIHKALFESDGDDNEDDSRDAPFTPKKVNPVSPRRTTPPREAKRRASVDTSASEPDPSAELKDDEGSSSKVTSASSSRKSRLVQERKQSQLARKDYKDLLPMERRLIETPRPGVNSWRHYGILMKFAPGTTNALDKMCQERSNNLAKERKTECDQVKKSYKRLINRWVDKGMRESHLEEPGVWTYPSKRCHWILMDPSYKTITGPPYSLEEQSDSDRVKDLPQATRDKLLPVEHRKRHLVTLADFD
ncbi:hypothetical protein PHPALM_27821 [Phytophthora palmivora]|uniref:Uncharacterized protein n=1 Tax=Phytophthora palmivora TaxID=4796 RepID=A0A2P4XBM3_9STRA|nr:hypothetical protein PHPALM_27821 [Phytophthora palmivora]